MAQEKIEKVIIEIIFALFTFIGIISILILVFGDKKVNYPEWAKNKSLIPNGMIAVICFLIMVIAFIVWKNINIGKYIRFHKFVENRFYLLLWGMSLFLFVVQIFISWNIYFVAGWDVSIVTGVADWIWTGEKGIGDYYYFSQYTNNIAITYMLAIISQIAVWLGYEVYRYFVCVLVDCLLINLAGVVAALSVKKLVGSKKSALLTFVIFAFFIGICPWMLVPYTDTYSILFPVFTFYLYLCAKDTRRVGKEILLWILLGCTGVFGYFVKPSAGIVLIAIICIEVVNLICGGRQKRRNALLHFSYILIAMLVTQGMQLHMYAYTGCDLNKDLQFTYTHYLMMGLNEENCGAYNSDDYAYECGFSDVKSREQGDWKMIEERLENYGVEGYIDFLIKKLLVNYNDGTFAWEQEGGFELKGNNNPVTLWKLRLERLFRGSGDWYIYYATGAQIMWISILFTSIFVLLGIRREKHDEISILCCSIIGIFLFVMLFEARARYLYNMAPMYLICASVGVKNIFYDFDSNIKSNNIKSIIWDKFGIRTK